MRTLGCLLGLLLTAMAGCQMASVSPIYTRDTVVIDDRVVGRWVERKEADREDVPMMIVEKDGRMPYRLRFGDRNEGKPEGLQHAGDLRLVLTRVGDEFSPTCRRIRGGWRNPAA